MTVFTISKSGGAFRLVDATGNRRASLHTQWRMRGGEIETPQGRFDIRVDRGRQRVTVGPEEAPLVVLDGGDARIAGLNTPAAWQLRASPHGVPGSPRQFDALLSAGNSRIEVHQSSRPGAELRADVTGTWPQPEVTILAACFGVMSARRLHNLRTLAVINAITPHGPR